MSVHLVYLSVSLSVRLSEVYLSIQQQQQGSAYRSLEFKLNIVPEKNWQCLHCGLCFRVNTLLQYWSKQLLIFTKVLISSSYIEVELQEQKYSLQNSKKPDPFFTIIFNIKTRSLS